MRSGGGEKLRCFWALATQKLCGGLAGARDCVTLCSPTYQELNHLLAFAACGYVQRKLAIISNGVDVSALIKESLGDACVVGDNCAVQWREAILSVLCVYARASVYQ